MTFTERPSATPKRPGDASDARSPIDASARRGRRARAIAVIALVASAVLVGLGLTWLLVPDLNPFGGTAMQSLASILLGPEAVAVLALAAGGAGVVFAAWCARGGPKSAVPTGIGATALALVLVFALGSISIIAFAGYLFGCLAVVAGVVTIAVMLVRAPRLGLTLLAGLIVLLAASVWLAGLTIEGVVGFAVNFGRALAADAPELAVMAVAVGTILAWAAIAAGAVRTGSAGGAFESWLVRHRRVLTILAALGPIPYAVARASWLTPWPLFGPSGEELSPAILATGLMLGSGAVAASVLTLGLILPWGRVFPTWMPRIGGRAVPVLAAAIPGFTAAGILCLSAVPMLVTLVGNPASPADALVVNLVLPLWFWGPMLTLAVWAYVAWRGRDE